MTVFMVFLISEKTIFQKSYQPQILNGSVYRPLI